MQLIFHDMIELREMIAAMGYVKRDMVAVDMRVSATDIEEAARRVATEHACEVHVADLPPIPGDAEDAQDIAELKADHPTEPTKRKRRTKAEIEADKAATEQPDTSAPADPLANLQPEPAAPTLSDKTDALLAITEMAGVYDGNDKLAHLNEAREFIAKHGFPTYNETLQLADVPSNIAAHSPEQVSRHRAAMAWRAAQ